jgi:NAD(P)-dependent dehydrogenase (short-subunit alcohol dehydrogenase family)
MSNPVVLIAGALTGIGRATALAFAFEGSHSIRRTRGSSGGPGGAPPPERQAPSGAGLLNATHLTAAPISPSAKARAGGDVGESTVTHQRDDLGDELTPRTSSRAERPASAPSGVRRTACGEFTIAIGTWPSSRSPG